MRILVHFSQLYGILFGIKSAIENFTSYLEAKYYIAEESPSYLYDKYNHAGSVSNVVNSLADPQLEIYLPITDTLVCNFRRLERSNSFLVCVETLLGSSKQ